MTTPSETPLTDEQIEYLRPDDMWDDDDYPVWHTNARDMRKLCAQAKEANELRAQLAAHTIAGAGLPDEPIRYVVDYENKKLTFIHLSNDTLVLSKDYDALRTAAESKLAGARSDVLKNIHLSDYVNAASINAIDVPHIVVNKLQQAMRATALQSPAQPVAKAAPGLSDAQIIDLWDKLSTRNEKGQFMLYGAFHDAIREALGRA